MFEKVNLSPLSITILTYLSRSPHKQFFLRKIARTTGSSVGGCHKVLKNMHKMSLIDKEKRGRNLYYKINDLNPAMKYFKIFINIQELNKLVKKIINECNKIILFGSCATGEDTLESDIDLLIITENFKEIKQLLKYKYINDRKLKPIILSPHEFIKLKNRDRAFYEEVNKGIVLWRGSNE
ncbi:MAG: nucleotidyltransferase domain-containing protein [Candidatus Methanofastidiosia archaeon]